MVGKDIYTNCGMVGQTEWPNGEARRRDEGGPRYPMGEQGRRTPRRVPNGGWTGARRRGTGARQRAHGCPTESGSGPTEGSMCARRRVGSRGVARRRARCVPDEGRDLGGWPNGRSRGWPNGGLYKCYWPSFLGTLLLCPVAPARNAGA
jgi:hypothetical protein